MYFCLNVCFTSNYWRSDMSGFIKYYIHRTYGKKFLILVSLKPSTFKPRAIYLNYLTKAQTIISRLTASRGTGKSTSMQVSQRKYLDNARANIVKVIFNWFLLYSYVSTWEQIHRWYNANFNFLRNFQIKITSKWMHKTHTFFNSV